MVFFPLASARSCRARLSFLAEAVGREFRPAADLLSFASPKESRQRKGDPAVCDPSLRYGQPAVLAFGGVSQNSLRSNSCEPLSAKSCAPRRSQRGAVRAIAALGHGCLSGHRFARPCCSSPSPLWGGGWGEGRAVDTGRAVDRSDALTPALSVAFYRREREQDGAQEEGGCAERSDGPSGIARPSAAMARRQRGRLFFGYFLLAKQKKATRPPGRDPADSLRSEHDRISSPIPRQGKKTPRSPTP